MKVELITPEQKMFSGEATGVKMPGIDGLFEILQDHAPLISALKAGELRINTAEGSKHYAITGGFTEVLNNNVIVLAESATEK